MRALAFLFVLSLYFPLATAQLTVTAVAYQQIAGVDNVSVFPSVGVVLVSQEDQGRLKLIPVVVVTVISDQPEHTAKVNHRDVDLIDQRKLKPEDPTNKRIVTSYLVDEPGTHWFEVIDFISHEWETLEITVGEPPDVDPPGTGPEDKFDNIGRRVTGWTLGASVNAEIAVIYREVAGKLRDDPEIPDVEEAGNEISRRANAVDGYPEGYERFKAGIKDDLEARWAEQELSRVELAEYFEAIAIGLEQ